MSKTPRAPQPFEWLTPDDLVGGDDDLKEEAAIEVNTILTAKFPHGPLVVKTATGDEKGGCYALVGNYVHGMRAGQEYIELPYPIKEGES